MPASILDPPAFADVGDTWRAWLTVTNNDKASATPDAVTVAITKPDSTAGVGTATAKATGLYILEYDLAAAGLHTIVVTVTSATFGDDVITFTVQARATSGALPDLQQVKDYLGEDNSYTDAEIQDALDAETAAQRRVCRIPANYPADLAQALKRRVARNLAARSVAVAKFTSFEGGGTSERVPMKDAEVTRLEGPFRKLAVG